MRLNETAKAELRAADVSQAAWARKHFGDGKWHGDACGCPDDRCIGFHHDSPDDCGCLPALLADRPRKTLDPRQSPGVRCDYCPALPDEPHAEECPLAAGQA